MLKFTQLKTLFLLVLTAISLSSAPSQAASFDCTHARSTLARPTLARSTLEGLICADPQLSALDENVGQTYATIRSHVVTGSARSLQLLSLQMDFLTGRTQVCPIPLHAQLSQDETRSIITCLKNDYTVRLSTLNQQIADIQEQTAQASNPDTYPQNQPTPPGIKATIEFARAGDSKTQFGLGLMYYNGNGVTKNDAEAVKWWRKSAHQGKAEAQFYLGFMFCAGQGVAQDYSKAMKWYRKAADQGNANAEYAISMMYYDGQGVTKDEAEAMKWLQKAADQGNAEAQKLIQFYNAQQANNTTTSTQPEN